jgi:hypothetical protein
MSAHSSTPVVGPRAVVNNYLHAFYSGDFERVRSVLDDSFRFQGPFLQVEGREAFLTGAEGLRRVVRGHHLIQQWVDGDDVSSLYEAELATPPGQGSVLMSEWHTVTDGRLASGRVVFDTAAFRALVPGPAAD